MGRPKHRAAIVVICQVLLGGYLLALLIGTHLPPGAPVLSLFEGIDKVCHFSAYAILAALIATTWQLAAGHLMMGHLRCTWFGVAVLGAIDELTQIPVGRDCSFWDWTADVSGAAVGLLLFVALRRLLQGRQRVANAIAE
jgi:VanZ family protein